MLRIIFKDGKYYVVGKVTANGADHEIDTEVTGEGVSILTQDQLKETYVPKASLPKRIDRAKAAARTELLQDDQFKAEALQAWQVTPADNNGGTSDVAERLKAERTKWDNEILKPVQDTIASLTQKVGSLQRSTLHSQILSHAAEVGVAEELLKPIGPKKQPMILNMVEAYFDLDEKTENFFVKGDGDDFEFTKNPQNGSPYMGVGEFMAEWAKNNPTLAPGARQKGPNAGNPDNPGGPVDKRAQIAKLESEGKLVEANALKAELLQEGR